MLKLTYLYSKFLMLAKIPCAFLPVFVMLKQGTQHIPLVVYSLNSVCVSLGDKQNIFMSLLVIVFLHRSNIFFIFFSVGYTGNYLNHSSEYCLCFRFFLGEILRKATKRAGKPDRGLNKQHTSAVQYTG